MTEHMPGPSSDSRDVVVVALPGDELREFSTLLFPEDDHPAPPDLLVCSGRRPHENSYLEELRATGRLRRVVHLDSANDRPATVDELTAFVAAHCTQATASVWTHNPADDHRLRSRAGLAVSRVPVDAARFYAHGALDQYQFVADVSRALSIAQIERKMAALNASYADQLVYQPHTHGPACETRSIASVERFVRLSSADAETLYALRHSMDAEAATAHDPWSFGTSRYEDERFRATTAWIAHWADPARHSLVEVGACEGHLTKHLHAARFGRLTACEPNEVFRARLARNTRDSGIIVAPFDLDVLADTAAIEADFYLLIEMLYYVQDLATLDRLPTGALMIAVDDEFRFGPFEHWLAASHTWRVADERPLAPARVEFCAGNKAYRRKAGSRGVLLLRQGVASGSPGHRHSVDRSVSSDIGTRWSR